MTARTRSYLWAVHGLLWSLLALAALAHGVEDHWVIADIAVSLFSLSKVRL